MKLGDRLPAANGAWDCAVLILKKEGLRSALVYVDSEVHRMADGGQFEEAQQLASLLVSLCNKDSVVQSHPDSLFALRTAKSVLDFLDRHPASKHTESLFRMHLLTCSNLAQVLKRTGDTERAHWYLECADQIVTTRKVPLSSDNLQYIASTKVNLSTLLLDLKRFPESIKYAEDCLRLLQFRLSQTSLSLQKLAHKDSDKHQAMLHSYLSAMFNIAMSEEALGRRDAAAKSYHACISFGKKYVPERNSTVSEAESALSDLLRPATQWLKQTDTSPPPVPDRHSCGGFLEDRPKYYSKERLSHIHAMIASGGRTPFYSSNQHFNVTVRKSLKLDQDCKHVQSSQPESASSLEHRSVTQLRLRKYKNSGSKSPVPQLRGIDFVQNRLRALTKEQDLANSQTVRVSKPMRVRTAALIDTRRGAEVTPPPQRLPPPMVQAEIEELMGEIQSHIKSLSGSPVRTNRSPTGGQTGGKNSELAVSVLHTPVFNRETGTPLGKLVSLLTGKAEGIAKRRVSFVTKKDGDKVDNHM